MNISEFVCGVLSTITKGIIENFFYNNEVKVQGRRCMIMKNFYQLFKNVFNAFQQFLYLYKNTGIKN